MRCPKCGGQDDKVIDSRTSSEGSTIRRRRECLQCQHRFTTYEQIERGTLMIVKRDGRREAFNRDKLLNGIQKACQKRPVSNEVIQELVNRIADQAAAEFDSEVPGPVLGEKVMNGLREVDEVAYVRYASVYRRFQEATDFVHAVKKLEVRNDTTTLRLPGV
ncbi:MAG: transcriptional regulator NrdR [Verrucomicrobiota bacterium]